jgi:hypothetical protein
MSPNNKGVNQAYKKVVFILNRLQAAMQSNVAFENAVELTLFYTRGLGIVLLCTVHVMTP